ncbi:MAG TPA: ABC transporter permease subunit, partial [Parachlamydiaceae bacterium]|nr:ABC transporter permease subunit [Parachlamydiaceae bacterium]
MEASMIDLTLIWDSLPSLLYGTGISLQITFIAAFIGLSLGSIFGLAETFKSRFVSLAIGTYVTLFRGTPMLIQIMFVYYVLPQFGLTLAPFWAASLAIGLNSGAYISQIILTGVNAVS